MTPSTDVVTTLLCPDTRVGFCCCCCLFVCLIDFDLQVFFSGRMTAPRCSYSEAAHIDTFCSEVGWPLRIWVDSYGRGGAGVMCVHRTKDYCRDTCNLILILKDFSHVSPRKGNCKPQCYNYNLSPSTSPGPWSAWNDLPIRLGKYFPLLLRGPAHLNRENMWFNLRNYPCKNFESCKKFKLVFNTFNIVKWLRQFSDRMWLTIRFKARTQTNVCKLTGLSSTDKINNSC
jgi:hypothetical protein